jgi:nicotinamidase-related amidase
MIENSKIKADKTALVVIDLQNGVLRKEHVPYTNEQVIQNAGRLIKAFTEAGAFVVMVKVSTADGKDLLRPDTDEKADPSLRINPIQLIENWDGFLPELNVPDSVHVITKRQWGAFYGTDLDIQLRRRGIETLVLCGIATEFGVDTTAREAYQHGYNQIFAEDAMGSSEVEAHEFVCRHIFTRMGKVRTCEEVLRLISEEV